MAAKVPPSESQPCLPKLRALGDPTRMRLVKALAQGESPVTALAESLGLTVYNASRHLKVLRDAGLVETEVSAQQRIYRLRPVAREGLAENKQVLQLGCCSFRLDEIES
ncbi:MAG: transcriptional regulator, ArsR family [Verrucomicrobiales bacterium]|nr:transcriptional regulator, ArsR family [Verrucomicrobiales bacterium]